ncbi:hypothetical protein BH09PSE5_BH09PSE5_22350 [soil metagenome]
MYFTKASGVIAGGLEGEPANDSAADKLVPTNVYGLGRLSAQSRALAMAGLGAAVSGLMAACSAPTPSSPPAPAPPEPSSLGIPGVPAVGEKPTAPPAEPRLALPLPPPATVANWDQVRLQAARRMVAANAGQTYLGEPPEVLLAIPVLEIELNADGSVRRIVVLRKPSQAVDTTQLAIAAVGRAAPYGDVSRLPKPWKFVETFLFDDERRFKPRSLN